MKRNILRRLFFVVVALVLVLAFSTTALADTWKDEAEWSSSICLYGFTTSQSVHKSSGESWACTLVFLESLSFSTTPQHNYCWATPRTTTGLDMGDLVQVKMSQENGSFSDIYYSKKTAYDDIKLRIKNPNSGNNMVSAGWWEGYIE